MFSRRTGHESTPNAFTSAHHAARARGETLIDLTVTNPTQVGLGLDPRLVLDALRDERALSYEPAPFGPSDVRQAVAAHLGTDVARTLLTASTSEAYAYAFAVLADPGDSVLVPRPSYPLVEWLARLSGLEPVPYELRYDGAWFVDLASLRANLGPRARAIVGISPNHPTGSWLDADELAALESFGLPLVLDEVFRPYALEREPPPRRGAPSVLTFRFSGLSKLVALPQMKVGFVHVDGPDADVAEALSRLELVADTYLSVSAPAAFATPTWLAHAPPVQARIRDRVRENLGVLDASLAGTAASRLTAHAGWCAIVRLPDVMSDEAHALALLRDHAVVVHPGYFYDLDAPAHVVVSLLARQDTFVAGARALRTHAVSLEAAR